MLQVRRDFLYFARLSLDIIEVTLQSLCISFTQENGLAYFIQSLPLIHTNIQTKCHTQHYFVLFENIGWDASHPTEWILTKRL
jgi:hypothetical protein